VQAVQALSEIRALAISMADRDLLARVNVCGSEAAAADAGLLDRLAEDGRRLEGFSSRVLTAELVSGSPQEPGDSHAVVRVRVVTSGYSVLSEGGQVVAPPSSGRDQSLRIVLERTEAGWRVARILPA
jgi:hypothetical protein